MGGVRRGECTPGSRAPVSRVRLTAVRRTPGVVGVDGVGDHLAGIDRGSIVKAALNAASVVGPDHDRRATASAVLRRVSQWRSLGHPGEDHRRDADEADGATGEPGCRRGGAVRAAVRSGAPSRSAARPRARPAARPSPPATRGDRPPVVRAGCPRPSSRSPSAPMPSAVRSCCSIGSNTSSGRIGQFSAAITAATSATTATPIAMSSGSRDGGSGNVQPHRTLVERPASVRGCCGQEADHQQPDPEELLAADVVEDRQRQQSTGGEGERGTDPCQERALVGQGEPIVGVVTDRSGRGGTTVELRLRAVAGRPLGRFDRTQRWIRVVANRRDWSTAGLSAAEHATVDGECVTGGERRRVGTEPHGGGGDLVGPPEPSQRAQSTGDIVGRPTATFHRLVQHGRVDRSGADRVRPGCRGGRSRAPRCGSARGRRACSRCTPADRAAGGTSSSTRCSRSTRRRRDRGSPGSRASCT